MGKRCLLTFWGVFSLQGSTSTCLGSRWEATPSASWAGAWRTTLRTGWWPTPGTPTGGRTVRTTGNPCPKPRSLGRTMEGEGGFFYFCSWCSPRLLQNPARRGPLWHRVRGCGWHPQDGAVLEEDVTGQTTNNPESVMLLTDSGLGAETPLSKRNSSSGYFIKAFYLFFFFFSHFCWLIFLF